MGRERVLGPEHPDTLTSVNNLAALLRIKGDYAQAEPLYRRALKGRERILGKNHPDTLESVNNLALLLSDKGDYAQAESLLRRLLLGLIAISRAIGREHPHLYACFGNYVACLQRMGLSQAEIEAKIRGIRG